MADCSTMSLLPAPKAGSASSFTSHDIGSQNDERASCTIGCTRTSAMPAVRNCWAAHSIVFAPDVNQEMRPHCCPDPISLVLRLSFENPTIVERSARRIAAENSLPSGATTENFAGHLTEKRRWLLSTEAS